MIQYVEGRLLDSKVNFIINLVNTDNLPNFDLTKDIYNKFPHVEIETNKYLRHCKKKCKSTIGTVQYIPTEYWALSLCNTMDNQKFEPYMPDCQYIVKGETRKITFRDDNFVIDSKSRFSDIVESIPLDADELIKAVTDAIVKEQSKSGISLETAKDEQNKAEQEKLKRIANEEEKRHESEKLNSVISQIVNFFSENKTNLSVVKPILDKCKELGYANPKEIVNINDANTILAMTLKA